MSRGVLELWILGIEAIISVYVSYALIVSTMLSDVHRPKATIDCICVVLGI